jgi:predicted lipoprotein with Yx(FWY)xxD motif
MKSTYFIVTTLVALTLLVSACAPAAMPTTQPPTAMAPATQAPAPAASAGAGAATVNLGGNSQYSSFLVDGKGMSLYLYTKDTPGTSNCYGSCAKAWPPLLTTGAPVAGSGVDASKFGTTTRTDGTTQVTYNGWPLYYYVEDQQAGDTTGQGVGSVWYLVTPTGDKVGG